MVIVIIIPTYGGTVGSLNSSGNCPSTNSRPYIVFKLPRDPHAMLLSIGYGYAHAPLPCRPCIVRFALVIVLRPLNACFPITTLLIFPTVGCIYQNIYCVQPHLQVNVIFRYFVDFINGRICLSITPAVSSCLQVTVIYYSFNKKMFTNELKVGLPLRD